MALIGAALSGCGSGDAKTTGDARSLTSASRAQFIAQAQDICGRLADRAKPLKARQASLKALPATVADKDFVSLARELAADSRQAGSELDALARRVGADHAVEGLLASFATETADVSTIAGAAASEEATRGEDAETSLRRSVEANEARAQEFGMKDCIGSE
jgi:hypothetical protein